MQSSLHDARCEGSTSTGKVSRPAAMTNDVNGWLAVSGTVMVLSAVLTFLGLSFFAAPYGKYSTAKGWGPLIPAQIAWATMESPNLWISLLVWYFRAQFGGNAFDSPVNRVALLCFLVHYINRSIIYPLRMRSSHTTPMPFSVMLAAFVFCSWNGLNQALALIVVGNETLANTKLTDSRCIVGLLIFAFGLAVNIVSDSILITSKARGEQRSEAGKGSKYIIPRGGFFEYVSCANYFGEIVEWWGFALLCWSYVGFAFALYATAYLSSRALHYHRWYQEKFEDYPKNRKAVFPFLL